MNNNEIEAFIDGVIEGCHFNTAIVAGVGAVGLMCPLPGVRQALLAATVSGAVTTAGMYLAAHAVKYIVTVEEAPTRLGDDLDVAGLTRTLQRTLRDKLAKGDYRVAKGVWS